MRKFFSGKKKKSARSDGFFEFFRKNEKLNVNYRSVNLGAERLKETSPVFGLLNAKPDEPVYKIVRLRLVDQNPVAIHTTMFHRRIFRKLRKTLPPSPLYLNISKNCGYTDFSNENSDITVSSLTAKRAKAVECTGDSLPV